MLSPFSTGRTGPAGPGCLHQLSGAPSPRLATHHANPLSASRRHPRRLQAVAAPPPPAPAAVPAPGKAKFASFDDMLSQSTEPILVDFYAHWCGPCKMMHEVLNEVGSSMPDLRVVKIDIDRYPALATKYRIQGLPTLVLFRNGVAVDRVEGLLDAPRLRQRLRYYMQGLESKFGRR